MAQRYGGRYSPQGSQDGRPRADAPEPARLEFRGRPPQRFATRINLLFAAPLVIVAFAFAQPPLAMAVDLAGAAVLFLAAWLVRDGVRAEDAFDARKIARKPAIPRKLLGSALTGIGVGLAVLGGSGAIVNAIIVGAVAAAAHVLTFGPDPMRDKIPDGIDAVQSDRVARVVDEAEGYLAAMTEIAATTGDHVLQRRVERFADSARQMCRTVEDDPRDLTAARKYLIVYLKGARDATAKFADIHARNPLTETRAEYFALIDDLESNFAARTSKMLLDDRSDLDVEIEVLRDRLRRDGVRVDRQGMDRNG